MGSTCLGVRSRKKGIRESIVNQDFQRCPSSSPLTFNNKTTMQANTETQAIETTVSSSPPPISLVMRSQLSLQTQQQQELHLRTYIC
mmetsp:Transcript_14349/g.34650  ORF Transcript_14349/g.34650 Transcript_14349/m.34650 type:complete len:87 (-) Transcript_14349:98-358(-)